MTFCWIGDFVLKVDELFGVWRNLQRPAQVVVLVDCDEAFVDGRLRRLDELDFDFVARAERQLVEERAVDLVVAVVDQLDLARKVLHPLLLEKAAAALLVALVGQHAQRDERVDAEKHVQLLLWLSGLLTDFTSERTVLQAFLIIFFFEKI